MNPMPGIAAVLYPAPHSQNPVNFEVMSHSDGSKSIKTKNLHLRQWQEADVAIMHSILQDPEVNYYLQIHKIDQLSVLNMIIENAKINLVKHGYGYFVCEDIKTGETIGLMGLNYSNVEAAYFPCHTISWILRKESWGQGYAQEAAKALSTYGFNFCNIEEIYACTPSINTRSESVMQRIGMKPVTSFEYPGVAVEDRRCLHELYSIKKSSPIAPSPLH